MPLRNLVEQSLICQRCQDELREYLLLSFNQRESFGCQPTDLRGIVSDQWAHGMPKYPNVGKFRTSTSW